MLLKISEKNMNHVSLFCATAIRHYKLVCCGQQKFMKLIVLQVQKTASGDHLLAAL